MKKLLVGMGKWMVIMLFLGYYISTTMFYHTHHFSWGTVTHSHPYLPTNSDVPNHNHTPVQCQAIEILSNLLLAFSVATVFIGKSVVLKKIYTRVYSCKSLFEPIFSPLRAPPAI